MTEYNGTSITYDEIGNPNNWRNVASFVWEKRELNSLTLNDGANISFTYTSDGIRKQKYYSSSTKTVNHTYTLDGNKIIKEAISSFSSTSTSSDILYYLYDASGSIQGFIYNNNYYYFQKNLQGDVIRILDQASNVVTEYTYDAWGKVLSVTGTLAETIGQINPFRYRGYYYDNETGLYYVSSRYYDPEIGRFINADTTDVLTATPMGLTDKNLFAYCDNNPVVRVDHGGQFWDTVFDVISLGASIVEVCVNPTDPWAWAGLAGDAIDLIPFVTGVGEVTRAVKTIDKVADTVQIAKAVDFTEDAADIVKTLDRSSGFTKSTASAGRKIHQGYKATNNFPKMGKEFRGIKGIRPDYIDFNTRTIYELKPMNPRGVRSGIRQLQRYNKALGGGFNLRLELY